MSILRISLKITKGSIHSQLHSLLVLFSVYISRCTFVPQMYDKKSHNKFKSIANGVCVKKNLTIPR